MSQLWKGWNYFFGGEESTKESNLKFEKELTYKIPIKELIKGAGFRGNIKKVQYINDVVIITEEVNTNAE